jgi:Rieske Fe-S protein
MAKPSKLMYSQYAKFDVRTRNVTSPPASEPEPAYEVKVDGNNILIKTQGKRKSP